MIVWLLRNAAEKECSVIRLVTLGLVLFFTGCAKPSPEECSLISQSHSSRKEEHRRSCVFLDPGHGGRDTGARSKQGKHPPEKDLNLDIVRRTKAKLLCLGYRVMLSRDSDVFVPIFRRVLLAKWGHADIFVSVHFNAAANANARGVEVFYFKDPKRRWRMEQSKRLGNCILNQLCTHLSSPSRGVRHGDLGVIRETAIPAVLVEVAFLSNPAEVKHLRSQNYRQKIAEAISKGIHEYFQ